MLKPHRNRFYIVITLLITAFIAVFLARDTIRSRWWAYRLIQSNDVAERGQYISAIMSVGTSASGAIHSLAISSDPDVRILATFALRDLPDNSGTTGLAALLSDVDVDVREAAATSLAFQGSPSSNEALTSAAGSSDPNRATAALVGLSRLEHEPTLGALCTALQSIDPIIRAQAAESTGQWLMSYRDNVTARHETISSALVSPGISGLASLLSDEQSFSGDLSFEREIRLASSFVSQSRPTTQLATTPLKRMVCDIAASWLSKLTGRDITCAPATPAPVRAELADDCLRLYLTAPASTQPSDIRLP